MPARVVSSVTARRTKSQLCRTSRCPRGLAASASAMAAASRSAGKLSVPPRKTSYTRAGCAFVVSMRLMSPAESGPESGPKSGAGASVLI